MTTILITGAGRGYGRALFDVYLRRGWTLFPLVRKPSVAKELQHIGGARCHPIVADVTTGDGEREIANTLGRYTEVLDVLINNAGTIKKRRGINETTVEDLEALFAVHCVGAFRCFRSALPFLRQSERAVVINISSRWGSIGRTVSGKGGKIYSYQIAKCGQNMLTVCLDQELKEEGIRVMAVHPGRLMTEVGAPDAETKPQDAAEALADWIEQVDEQTLSGLYDLMENKYLSW